MRLSLFLVPMSLTLAAAADDPNSPQALLDAGVQLRKQGKYDEAIRTLERARAAATDGALAAEVRVEIGETYFRKGKDAAEGHLEGVDHEKVLRQAAKAYEEVVDRYPKEKERAAHAAYMIGSSHLLLGDMQKAYDAYRRAYIKYPGSKTQPRALVRLGVTLTGLGDSRKAVRIFQAFLNKYPEDVNAKKVRRYINQVLLVGAPAPDLRVTRWLNGTVRRGLKDLRGEVVVLVFFGTWCAQCSKELPHLKREMAHWRDRGVVFLGVADPDDEKVREPVEFYVKRNRVDFLDVALDSGGRNWKPYRVTGLPAAVVIDRRGTVRWRGHFAFIGRTLLDKLVREN